MIYATELDMSKHNPKVTIIVQQKRAYAPSSKTPTCVAPRAEEVGVDKMGGPNHLRRGQGDRSKRLERSSTWQGAVSSHNYTFAKF